MQPIPNELSVLEQRNTAVPLDNLTVMPLIVTPQVAAAVLSMLVTTAFYLLLMVSLKFPATTPVSVAVLGGALQYERPRRSSSGSGSPSRCRAPLHSRMSHSTRRLCRGLASPGYNLMKAVLVLSIMVPR